MSPEQIVSNLLNHDASPPDEDYSPFEYGQKLGADVSLATRRSDVVRESWKVLPSTLAESFLEGFVENVETDTLKNLLLECIPSAMEVKSAGSIVRMLRERCGLSDEEIASFSLEGTSAAVVSGEQDRWAYCLRVVQAAGLSENKLVELLERGDLSEYATKCIRDCLAEAA